MIGQRTRKTAVCELRHYTHWREKLDRNLTNNINGKEMQALLRVMG